MPKLLSAAECRRDALYMDNENKRRQQSSWKVVHMLSFPQASKGIGWRVLRMGELLPPINCKQTQIISWTHYQRRPFRRRCQDAVISLDDLTASSLSSPQLLSFALTWDERWNSSGT